MRYTLRDAHKIIQQYVDDLQQINVDDDKSFFSLVDLAKKKMIGALENLRDSIPELLPLNYDLNMDDQAVEDILNTIKNNASKRYCFDALPSTTNLVDVIQGENIITPAYFKIESYNELSVPNVGGKDVIVNFLLTILLSLPIKKVRFTFVDLGSSYLTDYFYKNIDSSLYNGKPITNADMFKSYLDSMNERILDSVRQYGDVAEYNSKNKIIAEPYEIIVLLDDYSGHKEEFVTYKKDLDSIKKNGSKAGIYIINFKKASKKYPEDAIVNVTPIIKIPNLLKACVKYINDEAKKEEKVRSISIDLHQESNNTYDVLSNEISVPVGKNGKIDVYFKLDIVSHTHAFVLGQTGSGKSVFLHDIISGAMLKYSPNDIEFYLLDFKLGGVEFNRYEGKKHVHALLVDNSDMQITLEILRELKDKMTERGKLLRKAGVTTIVEYNDRFPNDRIKHIVFVADECHEMFSDNEDNRLVVNEISDVIAKIAKEGRSQGVHLLLSTQTLANTNIGSDILNNISDCYLLKCSNVDSERLVANSSTHTSKLKTGFVYYCHGEGHTIFQAYYADKQKLSSLMDLISNKTKSYESTKLFYFNGASIYKFEPSMAESIEGVCRKNPVVCWGKSIAISQNDVYFPLKKDMSENVLLLGLNDKGQATRTAMAALVSLLNTTKLMTDKPKIKLINCLIDDDNPYYERLISLNENGDIDIVPSSKRALLFKNLAEDVLSDKPVNMILFVLGQDRFRELKLNVSLVDDDQEEDNMMLFTGTPSSKVTSFSNAFDIILKRGPEQGLHTIMQLEDISKFCFEDGYVSNRDLFMKFKHLIMLRSDEHVASQLRIKSTISLDKLCSDSERLRAYYYSEDSDTYTLFTPYMV